MKVYKEYFVARAAITSLKENNIEDIVDSKIRAKLQEFVTLHKGEKFESVLEEFSRETGVKKVRCLNHGQKPIIINGTVPRYYEPRDYCAAIIWEIPPKKDGTKPTYKAQYFLRTEIGKNNKPKPEIISEWKKINHPAARQLPFLLHKDDYLEFSDNGKWYKCRIAEFSATNNKLVIVPIFDSAPSKEWAKWLITTTDYMIEPCWKMKEGKNLISVNVLFGEKQARFITVNPIGRVFRK